MPDNIPNVVWLFDDKQRSALVDLVFSRLWVPVMPNGMEPLHQPLNKSYLIAPTMYREGEPEDAFFARVDAAYPDPRTGPGEWIPRHARYLLGDAPQNNGLIRGVMRRFAKAIVERRVEAWDQDEAKNLGKDAKDIAVLAAKKDLLKVRRVAQRLYWLHATRVIDTTTNRVRGLTREAARLEGPEMGKFMSLRRNNLAWHLGDVHVVEEDGERKKVFPKKPFNAAESWVRSSSVVSVAGHVFAPDRDDPVVTEDETGFVEGNAPTLRLNLWHGYHPLPPALPEWRAAAEELLNHMGRGNQESIDYIKAWIKTKFDDPMSRNTILCISSAEQGSGKTLFATSIGRIFRGYYEPLSSEQVLERFNSFLENLLVVLNDPPVHNEKNRGEFMDKFREVFDPALTEARVRRMRTEGALTSIYTSAIVTANELKGWNADRRNAMIRAGGTLTREKPGLYGTIQAWANDDALYDRMASGILAVVSDFVVTPKMKSALQDATILPGAMTAVDDMLDENHEPIHDVFEVLADIFAEIGDTGYPLRRKDFEHHVKQVHDALGLEYSARARQNAITRLKGRRGGNRGLLLTDRIDWEREGQSRGKSPFIGPDKFVRDFLEMTGENRGRAMEGGTYIRYLEEYDRKVAEFVKKNGG